MLPLYTNNKKLILGMFWDANNSPICASHRHSSHVLLLCALEMSNKQFVYADHSIFFFLKSVLMCAVYKNINMCGMMLNDLTKWIIIFWKKYSNYNMTIYIDLY